MSSEENTNWGQSAAAVVIKDGKVLLARHTYGAGKGKLIIPGGYLHNGESPEDAVRRELLEETGISVSPMGLLAARFNEKDWYMVFLASYESGTPRSDQDENSEVLWVPVEQALASPDVPDLTKKVLEAALSDGRPLERVPYESRGKATLYTTKQS